MAFGAVPDPCDRVSIHRCDERAHCHLVVRQSSGLIRTDRRHFAERLDSRKFPRDRVALDHLPHAESECDRDDRWQPFRDGSYGKSDRRVEQLFRSVTVQQQADDRHHSRDQGNLNPMRLFDEDDDLTFGLYPFASLVPALTGVIDDAMLQVPQSDAVALVELEEAVSWETWMASFAR